MKVELFPFQRTAVDSLRLSAAMALNNYRMAHVPQVVSFTAPTGSGKTIIMAALIEDIFFGTEKFEEQPEAIFVWLSDSPQLNEQSKQKIDLKADKIRLDQCVTIDDDSFDREMLEDGHIYFLNTQKIGKAGNLTRHSDTRQYTIWETLENTLKEKSDRLYFIIDEAHRGMQGREAGKATSIMQKFLKGSPADKLSPMPVVFGMSATTARFNRLVEGIKTTTVHKVEVTAAEVRASGLLKDRIIITYPEDYTAHNDMAILQAATDEWKDKCVHWYQYSYEQHYAQVHPVFVIQVKNGSGNKISDTNLDDCLAKIEERINYRFAESEVVHTFGQTGTITVNGLNVPHIEASDITEDKKIKIVFFKENLSTGWDCPRAETMMSFRRAEDATWIAQLLGRMVRTPLQNRVLVDESLNDVHLYLPYFDKDTVKEVIDSLQEAEGGDIPTVLEGESYETPNYTTWTIRPSRHPSTKVPVPTEDQISLFGEPIDPFHLSKAEGTEESEKLPEYITHSDADCVATEPEAISSTAQFVSHSEITNNETANTAAKQLSMTGVSINRDEIVKFINDAGLLTYEVKPIKIYSYLTSMLKLARLLSQADISSDALKQIQKDLVDMIHSYVEDLKSSGKYDEYAGQVLQFKLATQVFDVFGETVDNYAIHSLFTTTDTDLDRQLRNADIRLGNFGISYEYGRKYYDDDNPNGFKIDVILFAADDDCIAKLNRYSEDTFHRLNDENRKYVNKLSERFRKQYHDIIADGDPVSKHSFRLPEILRALQDRDGKAYDNHLFVDEETGTATIKLNGWEEGVLEEEAKQNNFVCWIRNLPQDRTHATCSLCIPYEMNDEIKPTFPDFIVIRSDPKLDYLIDILEPHNPDFKDNLGKAKGFAKYAEENLGIGRIQLIRMGKDAAGKNRFKRLDMSLGSVRQKVLHSQNNDELDHIFDTDGFFM